MNDSVETGINPNVEISELRSEISMACWTSISEVEWFEKTGYPLKVGQFKIKPFVVILSATHCSQYKILELDLTGL